MSLIASWLTLCLGLWASHLLLSGFRIEGGIGSFLLVGAVVGILNWLFGWLIFGVLGIATLGLGFLLWFLTRLVATAVVLKMADGLSSRFKIDGFGSAFWAACIMSLVSTGVDWVLR